MTNIRIAVLMTCHNRRDSTISCLHALYEQDVPGGNKFDVFLVDDGSSDGTSDAVRSIFPQVKIIRGDGNLYWCGGMRRAWAEAMKGRYDYFLWLNDDTMLFPSALKTLICTAVNLTKETCKECIVVGSTRDPKTGEHSYGGYMKSSFNKRVYSATIPKECYTMNGNIVLIPKSVAWLVGNFSPEFTHARGDSDYALRAKKLGVGIWVAPGFQGFCKRNERSAWACSCTPLRDRWRILHSPKGLPPNEYLIFLRRHHGWRWPIEISKPYLRVLFPFLWEWLKKS